MTDTLLPRMSERPSTFDRCKSSSSTTSAAATTASQEEVPPRDVLNFITLSYNTNATKELDNKRKEAESYIMHNCLMINNHNNTIKSNKTHNETLQSHFQQQFHPPKFNFVIYTDDLTQAFCDHCQCVEFKRYGCDCPFENCTGLRNPCEKAYLYSDLLQQYGEFVFLDFDFIILKDRLLDGLYLRSRYSDFLATRAHGSFLGAPKYRMDFNSGLVFIRNIVDPMLLRKYVYDLKSVYDQAVLSYFVHKHYTHRWDELSIKWHCRMIGPRGVYQDMDKTDCMALHPPKVDWLRELNYTLMTPPMVESINETPMSVQENNIF